jgi:hypothetical protein
MRKRQRSHADPCAELDTQQGRRRLRAKPSAQTELQDEEEDDEYNIASADGAEGGL